MKVVAHARTMPIRRFEDRKMPRKTFQLFIHPLMTKHRLKHIRAAHRHTCTNWNTAATGAHTVCCQRSTGAGRGIVDCLHLDLPRGRGRDGRRATARARVPNEPCRRVRVWAGCTKALVLVLVRVRLGSDEDVTFQDPTQQSSHPMRTAQSCGRNLKADAMPGAAPHTHAYLS